MADIPTILIPIISAASGILGVWVTSKTRSKSDLQRFQSEERKQRNELTFQYVSKNREATRDRIERAYLLLSKIKDVWSLERSCKDMGAGLGTNTFDEKYSEERAFLHEARMIIELYLPKLNSEVRALDSFASNFWGHHRNALYQLEHKNEEAKQGAVDDLVVYAKQIGGKVDMLQNSLVEHLKETEESANQAVDTTPISADR